MVRQKTYLTFMLIMPFSACFGPFDNSFKTITGRYNVGWIDVVSSRSINIAEHNGGTGGLQIVPAYVFAVGHNENYIIAKQHPLQINGEGEVNNNEVNYYIIDIRKKKIKNQEGVLGPFRKVEFDSVSNVINISDIKFDLTYPDIP